MDIPALLRDNGLRATPGRIQLLEILSKESLPLPVERLKEKLKERLDTVTVYRTLEALRSAGLVERTDLQHGHAHYELTHGRPHHHHAICRTCGLIEDIEVPHTKDPAKDAASSAQKFSSIDSYALEFFGTCTRCA